MKASDLDAFVKVVQDVRRTLDYLDTRPEEFAKDSYVYYGLSGGVVNAPIILSLEPRFRLAVLSLGGFRSTGKYLPQLDAVNFIRRVKIPVLHFYGQLDSVFPYETSVKPFLDMLGTADENKKPVEVPGGHTFLTSIQARDTIAFLNQRLGQPR